MIIPSKIEFQNTIYQYYKTNGRSFPWRETKNPWYILISEMMLQQTQAGRVEEKYKEFIHRFPTPCECANSSFGDILLKWHGLGYNRRARYVKETAKILCDQFQGKVPKDLDKLIRFPGIGVNTAGAIRTFAFNLPSVFIETNIRTVIIHFFFAGSDSIHDNEIRSIVAETIDNANPRKWYWALMDYGVYLKKLHKDISARSIHYKKQSPFKGSNRELRGAVIKLLLEKGTYSLYAIQHDLQRDIDLIQSVCNTLCKENLIVLEAGKYKIKQ